MAFVNARDLRGGTVFKKDGIFYFVVTYNYVAAGNWRSFMQTKLRNLLTGATVDQRFRADDKLELADLENRMMQYLYKEGNDCVFMDNTNFEQLNVPLPQIGDAFNYMQENENYQLQFLEGKFCAILLPPSINLKIVWTEPGLRGDTATNVQKPAKLETGLEVRVPLFCEEGQMIKVDTRTGEYIERVK